MKNFAKFLTGAALVLFIASFTMMLPQSDNGWRGPNRDGKISGFEIPDSWPGLLTIKWQVPVGLGDASPVLHDGKIFLHTRKGENEVAICVDASSGKIIWEKANNRAPEVTGGAASHPGPRSTPAIAGEMVINVGAGGYVTCRNIHTGDLIWETAEFTKEVPQFFVSCSPLVVGNKCIIHLNGKENGVVVAFDLKTGKELWKTTGESATYSSPVRMPHFENMVVVQGENNLFGLSVADGIILWKFPTPGETRFYNSSTPIVIDDKIVIAGQGKGTTLIRVKKAGNEYTTEEVWNNPQLGVSFNTPVFKEGYLYGNEARFGNIYCLDARDGKTQWADTTKHNRFASMLDLGKVMATLPATGNIHFFYPDPNGFRNIISYKVAETDVYAHPILDKKFLFVKDKENLTCWAF